MSLKINRTEGPFKGLPAHVLGLVIYRMLRTHLGGSLALPADPRGTLGGGGDRP